MNEPPATLVSLVRLLGVEPSPPPPRWSCWALIAIGSVVLAWYGIFFATVPADGHALLLLVVLDVGLMLASQGAAGLLREDRGGLSMWFSVLSALLVVSLALLGGAQFYAWEGPYGAGAFAVFAVLVFAWGRARSRDGARRPGG